jgi:LPS sulfotransferase NodH
MADDPPVQRFMLLATARTGSNLLSSLLSAHPAIKMYGELFNLDTLTSTDLRDALDDPMQYLRARLNKTPRPQIAAVGFKMFYEHLTSDYFQKPVEVTTASDRLRRKIVEFASYIEANYDWATLSDRFREAWDALVADRTLAVIHLRRTNTLDTLISLKVAFVTGEFWTLTPGAPASGSPTIELSPDECQRYFERVEASAEAADALFAMHPKLEVTYEALVGAREETLKRIAHFLSVPYAPASTRMHKQITAPAADIVVNYDELKDHFRETRWRIFFEEHPRHAAASSTARP